MASTHDMMNRTSAEGESFHHCQFILFDMYTSYMKGTTISPSQLSSQ